MASEQIQPEYPDHAPGRGGRPYLAPAKRLLGLSNVQLRQLLGNRASDSAIRHWIRGRRTTPQWAIDILDTALARDIEAKQSERERLALAREAPLSSGYDALATWRARRAAQKEKARS
jgi:hypothetical protein